MLYKQFNSERFAALAAAATMGPEPQDDFSSFEGQEEVPSGPDDSHLKLVLQSAWSESRPSTSNYYTCEVCERSFNHPGNYKQHLASHARKAGLTPPKTPKQRCPKCHVRMRGTPAQTRDHVASCGGDGSVPGSMCVSLCSICDETFESLGMYCG